MRDMRPKPEWTRQQNAAPNAAGAVVTEHHRLLLQAALGDGAQAESAFKTWRARVPLDDIEPSAYRVLGHIVDTAIRNRVDDPEMPRIRGVLKHTWITNMRRMRALDKALYSLQCAGIQVMVLKGAALFARYPALCTQLAVGDFDIPVRPADGPRTIDTLMKAGFRPRELLPERFVAADFEKQHALSFEHNTVGGEIDVHWWPLPRWTSQAYVDELFARSELADLEGRKIENPGIVGSSAPDPGAIPTLGPRRDLHANHRDSANIAWLQRPHRLAAGGGACHPLSLHHNRHGHSPARTVGVASQRS